MEEEEEGQLSLEQTATSVAAGEEEEGELGEGTAPTDQPSTSASTSQTKEEEGEREKCGILELVGGVYTVYHFSPAHSSSLSFPLYPSPPLATQAVKRKPQPIVWDEPSCKQCSITSQMIYHLVSSAVYLCSFA